jgi:S1-C subfamily serine protease
MDQNQDFSSLRKLLALTKLDMPQDTQIDQFLAEFHCRQRAQLLVHQSIWSRSISWMKERMAGFQLVPSLSYGSAVAAIAITAFVGLSQQVQVTQVDGQSKLTFRMSSREGSFAMLPGSFVPSTSLSPKLSNDSQSFSPNRTDSAATRYVLANNSHGANDATVAVGVFPQAIRAADVFQLTGDEANALVDKAKAAVVQVRSGDLGLVNAGSGFFIDDQGTVLTSASIIGDNTSARVVINGVEMDAKIMGNDPRSGLAMLHIDYGACPSLPLARSSSLETGDGVVTIGYPLNLPVTSAQGPVSGFDASYLAQLDDEGSAKSSVAAVERFATTHIHANIAISPGQVGSPLLNSRGEVVGIVATSPDDGRSIYALPVEAIAKIMADFNQFGRARHGWVGVNVMAAPDTAHDGRTVRVVQVVAGTPASESGIRSGDTVMRIDSREIYRPADVLDASFFSQVGANMNVVVRREDKLYSYNFAVIERPENLSAAIRVTTTPALKNHVAANPR